MPYQFDPTMSRKFWLEYMFPLMTKFAPAKLTPMGRTIGISQEVNAIVDAYYVGLADRTRPNLEEMISWMESQPETEPRQHSKDFGHWRAGWTDLSQWRELLGLCKWLSRGDAATRDFAGALKAEWYSWTAVSSKDAAMDHFEFEQTLTHNLAIALAAKDPVLGLKFAAAAAVKEPSDEQWPPREEDEIPLLRFGEWACRHLAGGGKQDSEFADRGIETLRLGLPYFFFGGRSIEAALWLKAIFWDTGVARTPDLAIAKIYDFMPGIERPDFVPV